jgi:hypothetical protein
VGIWAEVAESAFGAGALATSALRSLQLISSSSPNQSISPHALLWASLIVSRTDFRTGFATAEPSSATLLNCFLILVSPFVRSPSFISSRDAMRFATVRPYTFEWDVSGWTGHRRLLFEILNANSRAHPAATMDRTEFSGVATGVPGVPGPPTMQQNIGTSGEKGASTGMMIGGPSYAPYLRNEHENLRSFASKSRLLTLRLFEPTLPQIAPLLSRRPDRDS